MFMKKICCLIVILMLLISSFGCSGNTPAVTSDPSPEVTDDGPAENTPTAEPEPTEPDFDFEPESKKIKVSWFVNWWEQASQYQYIFDEFSRLYPEYEIDYSVYAGDIQQLAASIQADTQADVWMGGDPNWAQYVTAAYQGLLEPIDEYLKYDPDYNFETVNNNVLNICKFPDGRFYSVPYLIVANVLIWNKDVFARAGLDPEKPPETWTEYFEYAKQMLHLDSNGMPTQLGVYQGPANWIFRSLRKEYVVSPDGTRSRFNEPWVMETDEYCGKFAEIYGGDEKLPSGVTFDVISGNVGMEIGNLISLSAYAENNVNFGFSKLPRPDDYNEQVLPAYIWMYIGIPKGAKNPKGGWKFLKYAVTEAAYLNAEKQFQKNPARYVPDYIAHKPTREKVYEMLLAFADPDINELVSKRDAMIDEINYYYPYSPLQMRSIEIGNKWWDKVTKGEINTYEMYEGIHTEFQAELDQWKKDMISKGWQFPDNGMPVAPWN